MEFWRSERNRVKQATFITQALCIQLPKQANTLFQQTPILFDFDYPVVRWLDCMWVLVAALSADNLQVFSLLRPSAVV